MSTIITHPPLKGQFLTSLSPRDTRWDKRKSDNLKVAKAFEEQGYHRLQERLNQCSDKLSFTLSGQGFKLKTARFCRVRQCPICQWRRSLMWFARFCSALPKLMEDYPTSRFLFLSLTVKNCDSADLKETLNHLNQSFRRLTQRKEWPGQGWIKSVEITRGKDDSAHPHIHALIMVPSRYFKAGYISKDKWIELWRSCLKVSYDPSIDIKTIKPRQKLTPSPETNPTSLGHPLFEDMKLAVSETVKYSVKPDDMVLGGQWLIDLANATKNTRSVALGGCFQEYVKADENDESDDDMIHTGLDSSDESASLTIDVPFGFHERYCRYVAS